jgi:hypothetical protein
MLKLSGSSFKVELVMRLLGLSHARDTMIGSAMVRVGMCCVFEQLFLLLAAWRGWCWHMRNTLCTVAGAAAT